MVTVPSWLWRSALAAGAVCVFVGGAFHPVPATSTSFEHTIGAMLADPLWVPSHSVTLVGLLLLVPGLLGLSHTAGSSAARSLGRFAVAGAVLAVVEMVFHVAAVVDLDALRAGLPTPVIDAHMVLETLALPLLGFSVASLAFLAAKRATPLQIFTGAVGMLGGTAFGLAGPVVVGTRNPDVHVLFSGSLLMSVWLLWTAVTATSSQTRRSVTTEGR